MDTRAGADVRNLLNLVGLNAQATAVGFVQLTVELMQSGILDEEAVGRIKAAIGNDLQLSRPGRGSTDEVRRLIHRRLDRVFAGADGGPAPDLNPHVDDSACDDVASHDRI